MERGRDDLDISWDFASRDACQPGTRVSASEHHTTYYAILHASHRRPRSPYASTMSKGGAPLLVLGLAGHATPE